MKNRCFKGIVFLSWVCACLCSVVPSRGEVQLTLLDYTSSWRYFTNGTDLGTAWRATNYNDGVVPWQSGFGLLGVETTPAVYTRAAFGTMFPAYNNNIITYYFRAHFNFPSNTAGVTLISSNYVDDGCAIFLNGIQVDQGLLRVTVGSAFNTGATAGPAAEGQNDVLTFSPATALRQGDNVVAVEVHQTGTGSSDIVWGMKLIAIIPDRITITSQPQSVTLPAGSPLTLSVGVTGTAPKYQWYRNNQPLAAIVGTNATYSLPMVNANNSGNYYVVVSNPVNVVTSSVAVVTVTRDNVPPIPLIASAGDTPSTRNLITVTFNEGILAAGGNNVGSYRLENLCTGGTVTISNAQVSPTQPTNLTLRVGGPNWDPSGLTPYFLTISNSVTDTATNSVVPPDNQIGIAFLYSATYFDYPWRYFVGSFNGFFYEPVDLGTSWRELDYTNDIGPGSLWLDAGGLDSFGEPEVPLSTPSWFSCAAAAGASLTNSGGTVLYNNLTYVGHTLYFRSRFDLSSFPYDLSFARVRLRHIVDDGAVFYLNGKEIHRFNMAPGTVNFSTLSTAAQTYEATCTTVPDFLATNLVKGVNVLAAELHHAANDNNDPDIVMGAALDITVASERPSLQITRPVSPPNSVRVSWAPGQCYTLEAATGLSGPWATITNASPYTVPRTNNFRFFRVKSKPMP